MQGEQEDDDFLVEPTRKTTVDTAIRPRILDGHQAYLVVVAGPSAGRMIPLRAGTSVLGRAREMDIVIDDPGVSRRHIRFVTSGDGGVEIADLGSRNGTFVNGARVASAKLADGDRLEAGQTVILKFSARSELEQSFQAHLFEAAAKDPATGVYSKPYFVERFSGEYSFAVRTNAALSVVLVEVDPFEALCEEYGRPYGDAIMRAVATKIGSVIRAEDTFARVDDSRFVILARESDHQRSFIWAERLRRLVQTTQFELGGDPPRGPVSATVSVGIATLEGANYADLNEMMAAAERYLDRARSNGHNRVESPLTSGA